MQNIAIAPIELTFDGQVVSVQADGMAYMDTGTAEGGVYAPLRFLSEDVQTRVLEGARMAQEAFQAIRAALVEAREGEIPPNGTLTEDGKPLFL